MCTQHSKAVFRGRYLKNSSPVALVICRLGVVISSIVQITLAIYLLRAGVTETLHAVNGALVLFSVSCYASRLQVHLINIVRSQLSV